MDESKNPNHELESKAERWNYIKGEVKKMKLLMEKYPKFVKREGSAKIILQIDAMFNAIENCPNPNLPVDLENIEGQLEEFKSILIEGFGQDLEKWRLHNRYSIHNVMKRISFILLIITSFMFVWCLCGILW